MRVLLTNNTLAAPAGSELSTFDVARTLKARGHEVAAFSTQLGEVADRLQGVGVTVVDQLDALPDGWRPDVVQGHHRWETGLAALTFPEVPVLSFCRGATPWQEAPCRAPNVAIWIAVDLDCRERLEREGVPAGRISVIQNGVDLDRFPVRSAPLPERPARALVLSNYAREDNYLAVIRKACAAEGIALDAVGAGVGRIVSDPSPLLGKSDLVFAKGKAALEGLVTGCGVMVSDEGSGLGPFVTPQNLRALRERSSATAA